jgi:NADPH:quinone reductase-like Zn-dependent oxidoreductase
MNSANRGGMVRVELVCTEPATPAKLSLRTRDIPQPGPGQLRVRLAASSVNPIDLKRAGGYGRRLIGLKGAARFPLVLGNDLAGHVDALGTGVTEFALGQRVFGLVGTGRAGGAHASHLIVPKAQLVAAPDTVALSALAVLPYSFTTLWLAIRSVGLDASNATKRRVLVHGACGGLGQLSLQLLRTWGARVTGICAPGRQAVCLAAGAEVAIERGPGRIASLTADFDAVLNFANWGDDLELASRLGPRALGQATTVHPLMAHFDQSGWLQGALASRRDWLRGRAAVASRAPQGRYAWTVFNPDRDALHALATGVREHGWALPIGVEVPFDQAAAAFAHVAAGKPGRAVLTPVAG